MMGSHEESLLVCEGLNFAKYRLRSKIGEGSFGEIFEAINNKTNEKVATKAELIVSRESKSQLRREAKVYHLLYGQTGIPRARWFGDLGTHYFLVMDLLGKSLEDLFNYCNRCFSLKTVLILGYELVSRIETVHSKGLLIHRDIKPENFLVGRGKDRHTIFIIDFGLAKHYRNPKTSQHISCRDGYSLTGTARYASINSHKGLEQSRRDDLFSIGYVLLYFLRGSLPWQGLGVKPNLKHTPPKQAVKEEVSLERNVDGQNNSVIKDNDGGSGIAVQVSRKAKTDKYELIKQKKLTTSLDDLCSGQPAEFLQYFEHVSTLSFEDTPDYVYLKQLFKGLFHRLKYTYDQVLFDWEQIAHIKQQHQQHQQQLPQRKQSQQTPLGQKQISPTKENGNNPHTWSKQLFG